MEEKKNLPLSTFGNELEAISLFVLLDLLGARGPSVRSFFKTTHWAYTRLAGLWGRMVGEGVLKGVSGRERGGEEWFPDRGKDERAQWFPGRIEDDHLPFMARGVEILHLIPSPFPAVWHTLLDDGAHLDLEVCGDWAVLMAGFVVEWMDAGEFVEGEKGEGERIEKRDGVGETVVTSKTEL